MTTIYCTPDQLKTHPANMRRFYNEADVHEMAGSIKATGGLLQAMLVVPNGDGPDSYYVVDGNMRLAGGRHLSDECPPLKCEVVSMSRAEQLLAMVTTTKFHYPKDAISEARHYQRLVGEEGYSLKFIAERTGVATNTIDDRLLLLELDEEIQGFIAHKKISKDRRVAMALLSIPNPQARILLARNFASRRTSIRAIMAACKRTIKLLEQQQQPQAPKPKKTAPVSQARVTYIQPAAPEQKPSRCLCPECSDIVTELAEELCNECGVKGLTEQCLYCPGIVEFVSKLIQMVDHA